MTDPPPLDWRYYFHNGLLIACAPIIGAGFGIRLALTRRVREDFMQRMGRYPESLRALSAKGEPVIWIHAVSVGEVVTTASVLPELKNRAPLARIVLTTTTSTGRETALKRGLEVDSLVYCPYDAPWAVRAALDAIRPSLLVLVDTELWPNTIALAHHYGARIVVANARFSDKAVRRARPVVWHYRWMLSQVDAVLAQSQLDADRYIAFGADPKRVEVTGSVKFDEQFPEVSPAAAAKLRQDLGLVLDVPVWVVGSSREGEEEYVLEAFRELRLKQHHLQLIIAPRHPERGDEVERIVRDRGYHPIRRTELQRAAESGAPPPSPADRPEDSVVILDTIGELARVYAIADVVAVGGSLVRWGGHNMLQPMAQGKPVVVGPHTQNFRDIVNISRNAEALVEVEGPHELATAIERLLTSEAERDLLSARALRVVRENRGASARTAERLVELLNAD
ncbi:MAG: 3-deoxy-D-manno-octulosonic acid transferase [Armatimonadetes bacterium]|nr:3-deoxy-D-manno-octulosonic acid transferase [Armatimonadota bacterium]